MTSDRANSFSVVGPNVSGKPFTDGIRRTAQRNPGGGYEVTDRECSTNIDRNLSRMIPRRERSSARCTRSTAESA